MGHPNKQVQQHFQQVEKARDRQQNRQQERIAAFEKQRVYIKDKIALAYIGFIFAWLFALIGMVVYGLMSI